MKRALFLTCVTLTAACSGGDVSDPAPEPAAALRLISGDGQLAKPGSVLREPLVVEAQDADGNPVAGVKVTWTAGAAGATLSGAGTTDAQGRATGTWTLGPAEGIQVATAETEDGSAVEFRGRALAGARPIAFVSSGKLSFMNLDGSDVVQFTAVPAWSPSWSPDGNQLLFFAGEPTTCSLGFGDLYLVDLVTMAETQVTHNDKCADVGGASWSADGGRIAFVRDKQIVVINADGSGEQSITVTDGVDPAVIFVIGGFLWYPDGSGFVFSRRSVVNGPYAVMTVNADGSGLRQLTDLYNARPVAFSPNGQRLAIMQQPQQFTYNLSIVLSNPDGSGLQDVSGSSGIGSFAWSPDGTQWLATVWGGFCGDQPRLVMYDVAGNQVTPKSDIGSCGLAGAAWRP